MRINSKKDLEHLGVRHRKAVERLLDGKGSQGHESALLARASANGGTGGPGAGSTARQLVDTLSEQSQPQNILERMIREDPELGALPWESDYAKAVPGRKFELDICLKDVRCGIEVDGWQYHGQHKESFLRDREKDYLLTMGGWQILRIQAGLISSDPAEALARARAFIAYWKPRQEVLLSMSFVALK